MQRLPLLSILLAAVLALTPSLPAYAETTDIDSSTQQSNPIPSTTVGNHVRWLLEASKHLPLDPNIAAQHFSGTIMQGNFESIHQSLQEASGQRGLTLVGYRATHLREDQQAFVTVQGADKKLWHITAIAAPQGLLQYFAIRPLPTSWQEFDQRFSQLGANTAVTVAKVTDYQCQPIHGLNQDSLRPVASGFKLWVLGALGDAVSNGSARWDEKLPLRDNLRVYNTSPVGAMPAGTELTLQQYAEYMIYFSDNTATDHLIDRLGRQTIEQQQYKVGVADPGVNIPLITTRDATVLKSVSYPSLANQYLSLQTPEEKRAFLEGPIASTPLGELWREPRHIDTIEWFATPNDMCRTLASLKHQVDNPDNTNTPIGQALALEGTTSLGLSTKRWPVGYFKGGSEPGVLSRHYLATDKKGQTYAISAIINDAQNPINTSAKASELLALLAGAFELSAR